MKSFGGKEKRAVGAVFSLFSIVIFGFICTFVTGNDIWYDEVFSLAFVKKSFGEIIEYTSRDVHPPFYYFYLKVVTSAICSVLGQESFIIAAKIASLLPWIFLFILSITYIKKRFGMFTSGLFMLLITMMPQIPTYYVEIRMYSLALFFITSQILLTHKLLSEKDCKNTVSWILFYLIGILTAYTQYYACIAIIGCYIALFLGLFFSGREDKKASFIRLFSCSILSVILYLPWLPHLKSQMESISGKYWIQPLTLRSLGGCAKFILLPVVYMGNMPVISAGLLILALLIMLVLFITKLKNEDLSVILSCLLPIVTVVFSGFILSAMGTPIFVYRYLIPTLGGLWLFVAYMTEKAISKRILLILTLPMLLVGGLNMKGYATEEGGKLTEFVPASKAISDIPEGSVIITNFDHVSAITAFYRPDCKIYLYEAEIDPLLPDMLGNITDNINTQDVSDFVSSFDSSSQGKVYFFGSFNSRDEIVASWAESGVNSNLIGSYLIERYWINIYELNGANNG